MRGEIKEKEDVRKLKSGYINEEFVVQSLCNSGLKSEL